MGYVSIEVDTEEFYDGLTRREREELIEWLREDGYLPEEQEEPVYFGHTAAEFHQAIETVKTRYMSLSVEDIQTIINISKKY